MNVDATTLGGFRPDQFVRNDYPGTITSNQGGAILGVFGTGTNISGVAVYGEEVVGAGIGVTGSSNNSTSTSPGYGVYGRSFSPSGSGVLGIDYTNGGVGVWGQMSAGTGVLGTSGNGYSGVVGQSTNGSGNGVQGSADSGYGVSGVSATGIGVYGHTAGTTAAIYCDGDFVATGFKSFLIDHPLDPANRTLRHFCTEGSEALDLYSGNVVTDAKGYATVKLPDWFESINRDFRYQLTVVDETDSDDFVSAKVVHEIAGNEFRIRTSVPGTKVSWQVTATRDDAWARAHPTKTEEDKTADERGRYLTPEAFGQPEDRRVHAVPSKPR